MPHIHIEKQCGSPPALKIPTTEITI